MRKQVLCTFMYIQTCTQIPVKTQNNIFTILFMVVILLLLEQGKIYH